MGWFSSLWHAIAPALTPIGVLLTGWLHAKVTSTPSDADKAAHLAQLARDAAALAYSLFPNLPQQELVAKIVAILSTIAGVPTTNKDALERAATGALLALKPPGA
jgi:hypothetical protein